MNIFSLFKPAVTLRASSRWLLGCLCCGLLASLPARAQFPRAESFKKNTTNGFTVGGSATLTGGSTDANGAGYLRLTSADFNQSGYAIDQTGFLAPQGFSISFDFFAYGGTGADGFSVFLVDDAITSFTPGASGGSLGYAQKTFQPVSNGVPKGYIGIGIDEFGNYANPTEGRVGGPGFTPNAVSIRGPGNGQGPTDYPYLAGSGRLPFSLDVRTVRAQSGSADYRRAYIDLVPIIAKDTTYQVTVRIQHGNDVTTAIRSIRVPSPSARLRIGFAGSTGSVTNIHEIRSLAIVRAPFTNDDLASTPFDQPVTLDVLANDVSPGSDFRPDSLDIDITQPWVQYSRTIPGKGTFSIDANHKVVFTPSGTFAGTVSIPYTVQNVLGDGPSSPATITIIVLGADVATTVSGPSAANPGSTITYTLNTVNLGTRPATNVVPTLTLAPALPVGSVVLPAGASYDPGTGVVTFATIATLPAGATPVGNSVTLTLPTSGVASLTGTGYATSNTPDPVDANNTSSVTTNISGIPNVATRCAEPGKDGPGSLGSSSVPNTYYPPTSGLTVSTGATSIPLGAATAGTAPIQAGDIVLLMQMQGATISTSDDNTYGSLVTGPGTYYTAGQYEYGIATADVPLTGGTLTLAAGLTNAYANQDYDGVLTGQRRFQVIRVPQYSSLSVTGTVAGAPWNGQAGGILALDVAGKTTFDAGASLSMDAKGFRGGGGVNFSGSTNTNNITYRSSTTAAAHGSKGEGLAGTPQYVYDVATTTVLNTTFEGYLDGSDGKGAPGNAGGGGDDFAPANNTGNAGGGGGGNGGTGGQGGYGSGSNSTGSQAAGGNPVSSGSAGRLFLGGGGGAGSSNDPTADLSSGGAGGGIIVLRTGSISGTGTLSANGSNAVGAPSTDQGGGGGGAGGTILLLASPPTGVTDGLSGLTLSALGGNGGNASSALTTSTPFGPGGGGGGGLLYSNSAFANASAVPTPVASGTAGQTTSSSNTAVAFGASAGTAGIVTTNTDPTTVPVIAGSGDCLPMLTAQLTTLKPTVTRVSGSTGAINPTQYVLAISNTGGVVRNVSTITALADNIIGYDNTVSPTLTVSLANGTSYAYSGASLPGFNGTSTPSFGNLTIPAGATISISFQATLAAAAQNNFAYQANASLSYLDPTRIGSAVTVQPGGTYESYANSPAGVAAAPGSGYFAASSTGEDVTVVAAPLPVTLTRFEAVAAQYDALLTWTTASELNSHHFAIERSLDGSTFEPVGSVPGQGSTVQATNYRFVDLGAGRRGSDVVYYRLRQVDTDGTATLSPVRIVQFARATRADVALYPNPAPGHTTLDLTGLPAGSYQVQVLDLLGRVVRHLTLAGLDKHPLPVQELASGSYVVRVLGDNVNLSLRMTRE